MKPSAVAVLELLRERGERGLTDGEAHSELHQTRLAARVADLKAEGVQVHAELVQVETVTGTARVARYWLAAEPPRRAIDWPVGKPRECPSCRDWHCAGQTCDMNRQPALRDAAFTPAASQSAAGRAA